MNYKSLLQAAFIVLFSVCYSASSFAQEGRVKDRIEGMWYSEDSSAKIKIYQAKNKKFYGKIVWLREPNGDDGKPKLDKHNPKTAKQKDPVLNMLILRSFVVDGDDQYDSGKIYDPKSGKTYSCTITHKGTSLKVRGYVGISLLGRTAIWTMVE